jgi:hypothetical protein
MTGDTNNGPSSLLSCSLKRKRTHLQTYYSCRVITLHARYPPMVCFTNVADLASWLKRKSIVN